MQMIFSRTYKYVSSTGHMCISCVCNAHVHMCFDTHTCMHVGTLERAAAAQHSECLIAELQLFCNAATHASV